MEQTGTRIDTRPLIYAYRYRHGHSTRQYNNNQQTDSNTLAVKVSVVPVLAVQATDDFRPLAADGVFESSVASDRHNGVEDHHVCAQSPVAGRHQLRTVGY